MWNGDRRLKEKFGKNADAIRERTSVVPFAAILSGRQQLPADYYREFLRPPYLVVVGASLVAYHLHSQMIAGSASFGW